VSIE
jgi:hypothetical protein